MKVDGGFKARRDHLSLKIQSMKGSDRAPGRACHRDERQTKEQSMAKGQQRSNRELKKPKMKKPAVAAPTVSAFRQGSTSPIPLPKKKG
jgi:hypothetical protein